MVHLYACVSDPAPLTCRGTCSCCRAVWASWKETLNCVTPPIYDWTRPCITTPPISSWTHPSLGGARTDGRHWDLWSRERERGFQKTGSLSSSSLSRRRPLPPNPLLLSSSTCTGSPGPVSNLKHLYWFSWSSRTIVVSWVTLVWNFIISQQKKQNVFSDLL